ncbi:MAG: hypothetical protein DCC73_14895 [Proteobacteria bacterium]|nr:MAG: hypothetical protein DCC73_14895 [Pseudomonadota bacterium]
MNRPADHRKLFLSRLDSRQEAVGLSDRALSLMVTGKPDLVRDLRRRKTLPRIDIMQRLAAALHCTVEYLMGETTIIDHDDSDILSASDIEILEQFVMEALKYRGELPPEVVAELAVGAFRDHHKEGYQPDDLRKVLSLYAYAKRDEDKR